MKFLLHLFALSFCSGSLASLVKRGDPVDTAGPPTATVVFQGDPTQYPKTPPELSKFKQIHPNSYFYIDQSCYNDKTGMDPKWNNRGNFFESAYRDALEMANDATTWPQQYRDIAETYFGVGIHNSPYADELAENIAMAAQWDNGKKYWADWIFLRCDDATTNGNCTKPIHDDPQGRKPTCYTQDITNWWWVQSNIYCCDPFFKMNDLQDIHDQNAGKPPEQIADTKLGFFINSGSVVLHEMMHTWAITRYNDKIRAESEHRRKIIDRYAGGRFGKYRLYGPDKIAKWIKNSRPEYWESTTNADSYAVFATAIWARLNFGATPKPYNALDDDNEPLTTWDNHTYTSSSDQMVLEIPQPQRGWSQEPIAKCEGTPSNKPPVQETFAREKIIEHCTRLDGKWINSNNSSREASVYAIMGDNGQKKGSLGLLAQWDTRCNPVRPGRVMITNDSCQINYSSSLNYCNTDSRTDKWGGVANQDCVNWILTTSPT